MKIFFKRFAFAIFTTAALLFASCSSDSGSDGDSTKDTTVNVESISLNETSKTICILKSEKTFQLTATINPSNATNKNLDWDSSDNTVATVTQEGLVEAKEAGTATITVKSQADSTKTATCTVTVTREETKATSITVNGTNSITATGTTELTATITPSNYTDTIEWSITSGSNYATLSSTTGSKVTLTGKNSGEEEQTVTVTVTAKGIDGNATKSESYTVTVKGSTNMIKASDLPMGFASLGSYSSITATTAAKGSYSNPVTTKKELRDAISKGGIIYIQGMIDMTEITYQNSSGTEVTESMLPSEGGKSNDALDNFVKVVTGGTYTTYEAYQTAYANACKLNTDEGEASYKSSMCDLMNKLNQGWKNNTSSVYKYKNDKSYWTGILIEIPSNTILIGKDGNSGIKGGSIRISDSNVIIRNLTFEDAYDPFPHHEQKNSTTSDGYNAQYDAIFISGGKNVWIDHCTLKDTKHLVKVKTNNETEEKWQTYDGLIDMSGAFDNVTVSYCKIMDHDKTMLMGSSDTEKVNSVLVKNTERHVTLCNNYYYNCGQRLPMVRLTTLHTYNNFFSKDSSAYYSQQYAIGVRKDAIIYSESNYFDSGIAYAFKDSDGKLYENGSNYTSGQKNSTITGTTLFSSTNSYSYTPMTAAEAKTYVETNAGAGKWPVQK